MKTSTKQKRLRSLYTEVCITLHREDDYECEDKIREKIEKLKKKKVENLSEEIENSTKKEIRDMLEKLNKKRVNTTEILRSHNISLADLD